MTLQAFFDDSGTKGTGHWLVVSGLFGETQLFAHLSEEWDKAIRSRHWGAIRYFKMDEACGLDGEFKFWKPENRDGKVRELARVIDCADLRRIGCVIDLKAFANVEAIWIAIVEIDSVLQLSIKADQILYELAKGHNEDEAPAKAEIAFNVEDQVREGLETLVKGEGRCVIVG